MLDNAVKAQGNYIIRDPTLEVESRPKLKLLLAIDIIHYPRILYFIMNFEALIMKNKIIQRQKNVSLSVFKFAISVLARRWRNCSYYCGERHFVFKTCFCPFCLALWGQDLPV